MMDKLLKIFMINKYIILIFLFKSGISYSFELFKLKNINTSFKEMCINNDFSGNVLIANYNKIIFKQSCGLANRDFNVANREQTKFNLGSIGKLFTSISIAKLIQENKLSLDEKVYKILPGWLPSENDKKITVKQLLVHASGLGNFMDNNKWKFGADSGLFVQVNDYKDLIKESKRLFIAGESQKYSNDGYVILGAIVESLSHESYVDYVNKNIFQPAKMKNTGIWRLDESIPMRSEGYFLFCLSNKCEWKNNNFEAPFVGSPAGGAYSTIEDMFLFSKALQTNKLLNSKMSKMVFSDEIVKGNETLKLKPYNIGNETIQEEFSTYGFAGAWNPLGFAVWTNPFLIGHTGGTKGASAFFATSPHGEFTIIILSNIDGAGPIKLYKNIRESLGFSSEIINY